MGIRLDLQYRTIALVSDYRSEISLQYSLLFYCMLYNNLALWKGVGLVCQADV